MNKVPYTNTGKNNAHIDGKVIRPGQTREVDPRQIPGYVAEAKQETAPADPLQELLAMKVPEIVATLPGLEDDAYAAVKAAEEAAEKPRKGLLNAFAEEDLRRADEAANADQGGDTTDANETEGTDGDDSAPADTE